ncbi:hypothetical protein BKA63DRAFT_500623, partial [Paraphoma chrysanthemicola]
MNDFEHEPLDLDSTTICLVRATAQGENQPVQCELFLTYSLDETTFYECEVLSYTWGGSEQHQSIILNGKWMAVTENHFQALRHLRDI